MTQWFGRPWPAETLRAPVCRDDGDRVPTPAGDSCRLCNEPVLAGDQGLAVYTGPVHIECVVLCSFGRGGHAKAKMVWATLMAIAETET